jgi:ketosteroid isomerase-like protein
MNFDNEVAILHGLMQAQVRAIREKNIDDAVFNYAVDVLIFDVVGPLGHPRGVDAVRDRLGEWFSSFAEGEGLEFELVDLSISVGGELAFSHSYNHVHGLLKNGGSLDMFWRETLNWERRNGEWKIVHAHSSVPFDAATGKALTGLRPEG